MPETVGEAFVAIRPDAKRFATETETAVTTGVKSAAGAAAGLLATYGVAKFLSGVNAEARESQKVGQQTAAVLKSTAGAANIQQDAIESLAGELSKKAGIDDEVIQSGENMLLTFKNIRNEQGKDNDIFNQTTKAALDMAAGMAAANGGAVDLKGASIQLGKALNDPVQGITALTRVGVTFTEAQKAKIKSLVDEGKILEAQKIILREVNSEFAGSAAAGATDADKAAVAIGNLKESIGTALLPVIDKGAQAITGIAEGFESIPAPAQQAITYLLLAGGALVGIGKAAGLVSETRQALGGIFDAIKRGGSETGALSASTLGWISVAALAVGAAKGLTIALNDNADAVNLNARAFTQATDKDLDKLVRKIQDTGDKIGGSAGGKLRNAFDQLLKTDPGQAQRFIDALDRAGIKTGAYKKALEDAITGEAESNAAHKKHQDAVDAVGGSYEKTATQIDKMIKKQDELTQKQDARANADLRVQSAQLDLTDALNAQYDAWINAANAGGMSAEANEALARQTIETKQAILDDAQAVRDQVTAHYGGVAGANAYKQELERLAGTLAPDNPLRQYIQGLIDDINSVPTSHNTKFTIDASEAYATLDTLDQRIRAIFGISGGPIPNGVRAPSPDLSFLNDPNNPFLSGKRASGGPVGAGNWLVGERGNGGELLSLAPGSKGYVTDAAQTATIGGETHNYYFTGPAPTHPTDFVVACARRRKIADWAVG